jgi:hypothetical protein
MTSKMASLTNQALRIAESCLARSIHCRDQNKRLDKKMATVRWDGFCETF